MKNIMSLSLCAVTLLMAPVLAQVKPFTIDSVKAGNIPKMLVSTQEHIPKAPKTIQSPNAATLGAYGEIPVSLYAGKPEITIDLHSLGGANVSIPIALHYDAAGVRPDVHAGWTGLNFSLSTNYSVRRTVKDGYDEYIPIAGIPDQLGYMNTYFINNGANWAVPDTIKKTSLTMSIQTGTFVDTEPDEYAFNAPGLSGYFYLGSDGTWKVQCDRPVKIELITTQNIHLYTPFIPPASVKDGNPWAIFNSGKYMEHFQGFVLTDEFGTKYTFGGSDMAFMEYSIDFFDQGRDTWACNAWYLKSIVSPTGHQIDFVYERGDFVNQMYFSVYKKLARVDGGWWFGCENWSSQISEYGPYTGKLISPIYLKEIVSDNFKVKFLSSESTELRYSDDIFTTYENRKVITGYSKLDFLTFLYDCYYPVQINYPNGCGAPSLAQLLSKLKWRKLDKIQIQNGNGQTVKEFELTYNNVSNERLMLQKVREKSGYSNIVLPGYEFTYFSNGNSLPAYCKSHTDHWGFNNGKLINIQNDYGSFPTYGDMYRKPDLNEDVLRLGSLIQMKYPTGGITKFRFEAHRFAKEVKLKRWEGEDMLVTSQLAGGLRIKEIQSYDPGVQFPAVVKKYFYPAVFNAANPDTAANVLSSGILGGKAQYYWPDYKPLPDDEDIDVEEEIFSTQSVLPASENAMGAHIGYSQVVELSSAGGWTVHKFSNFDNGYRDEAPSGFLQISTTPYQPCNNKSFTRGKKLAEEVYYQNGSPVSKINYQYNFVGALQNYSARSVKTQVTFLCGTTHATFDGTAYIYDVRKFLPSEVTQLTYDQDNPGLFSTLVKTQSYWPNGQVHIEGQNDSRGRTIKTWYKYPPNLGDAVSNAMVVKNIVGPVREIFRYTGTEMSPAPIKATSIPYDLFAGTHQPQKVQTKLGNAAFFNTEIEFLSYDPRGNLLTYKELGGSVQKMEYFGLADIGKVDLLKKRTSGDGTSIATSSHYTYKAAIGVETVQDPNGKTTFYDYDNFNRIKSVSSNNAAGPKRISYCYNIAGQVVECAAIAPTDMMVALPLLLIAEAALPVTLIKFTAIRQENASLLSWITAFELNSDHFEIERSHDGRQWESIGKLASQRESNDEYTYIFRDSAPLEGENLYRLRMVDQDGTYTYSRIESVIFDSDHTVVVHPNPVTVGDQLSIRTSDTSLIRAIAVFNAEGDNVLSTPWKAAIDISRLPPGLYIVRIFYHDGSVGNHRIVRQ